MPAPSVRRRTLAAPTAAVAAAVTTAAVCGVLLAPAAHASTPATGLTATIGDATHDAVTRGHGRSAFTLTVTNDAATPQAYTGELYALPAGGPSPVDGTQISLDVRPLTAPATGTRTMDQVPGVLDAFFPQGTGAQHPFQVPAGASYSWRVTVGFGADFPGNDDGLDIALRDGSGKEDLKTHVDVSPALPDGAFTESFTHAVTVGPGAPGTTALVLDDEAGGAFTKPLDTLIQVYPSVPGLGLDVRAGGAWVPATALQPGGEWKLPQLAAGFARGQKHRYELRFSTTARPVSARQIELTSLTWLGSPIAHAQTSLNLVPATAATTPASAQPSTPATTPAATASTATSAATAPASPPVAAAPATDTPSPTGTGSLAHTGSSSRAGLFAGIAALLAAAGAALIAAAARRRGRSSHR